MIPLLTAAPSILTAAATLVPSLARWIGGDKAGDVADKVAGVVNTLTGQTDPMQGLEAIKADPALLVQFQRDAMNIDLEFYRTEVDDRKNARATAVAMADRGDHTPRNLAYMIVGAFILTSMALVLGSLFGIEAMKDPALASMIGTMVGYLANEAKQISSFYWGSSKSSQTKDATIQKMAGN